MIEEEQPGVTGGRLAKVQAEGSASDEEEEWYDATEEVEAVPLQAGGSWWEQDNVDAADVEAHLLKDIHQKGMLRHAFHACCVTCQPFMLHPQFHRLTQLQAIANGIWQSRVCTSATQQTATQFSMLRLAQSMKSRELLY